MKSRALLTSAGPILVALACQRAPERIAPGLALTSNAPPSTLLRLPAAGGTAQIYRLPGLTESGWKSREALPALRRPIGADLDQDVVYAIDTKSQIVALDLRTGRARPPALGGQIREATIGPDGVLYAVNDSNVVTQIAGRNPTRFGTTLPGAPRDLFGTKDDQLLALTSGRPNTLTLLTSDQPPTTQKLPAGDVTATFWGDLVALAADTAVILYDVGNLSAPISIRVSGHARAVAFSPSGHRLYVARREGGLLVLSRYTQEILGELKLPGPAGALRPDPFGRWLLIHPPAADSVWVVDLATGRYTAGFATAWGPDLPTVTNQQILLLKQGADIIAVDLARTPIPTTGKLAGGARDLWLPLAWTPETGTSTPTLATRPDSVEADTLTKVEVFLQVSSSQNPAWAQELAKQLSDAGLPASVVSPTRSGDGYRVVLGPYASREDAEATGRKLGRPFFIYQSE